MAAEQATVAEQEYLETMFWIDEAGLPMTGANIARAMQLSAPTVHKWSAAWSRTATSSATKTNRSPSPRTAASAPPTSSAATG